MYRTWILGHHYFIIQCPNGRLEMFHLQSVRKLIPAHLSLFLISSFELHTYCADGLACADLFKFGNLWLWRTKDLTSTKLQHTTYFRVTLLAPWNNFTRVVSGESEMRHTCLDQRIKWSARGEQYVVQTPWFKRGNQEQWKMCGEESSEFWLTEDVTFPIYRSDTF